MVTSVKAYINSDVLIWARETAEYSIEEISHKMGKSVSIEKIKSWEEGKDFPTYHQLLDLANYYKRPVARFFSKKVPKKAKRDEDFRFLPNSKGKPKLSHKSLFELRDAKSRRETTIILKEELNEEISPFSLKIKRSNSQKAIVKSANKIRDALGVSITQQLAWKTPEESLKNWISKIEDLDVLVFQFSGVNPKNDMRGYAIYKDIMPIIGINGKEHANGKIFTLFHEFIHIILRKGGISNLYGFEIHDPIEIYCNKVAGEILVPEKILKAHNYVAESDGTWEEYKLKALSRKFKVSREVILRRLLTFRLISPEFYNERKEIFLDYIAIPPQDPSKKNKGGGGDLRALMSLRNNGFYYTNVVIDSFKNELITTSELSDFLGVKLRYVPEIEQRLYQEWRNR